MQATIAVMPRRKKSDLTVDETSSKSDTIRVEGDIAYMATIVATRRKISVSELVSPHLRPFIQTEYAKEVKAMYKGLPGGEK